LARVTLRGLTKKYGEVAALDGFSLDVPDKSLVVLLGPTGAGKTTSFKCTAGLVKPDDGEVLLDGESVNDVPPWERDVAMLFQTYALYPHMNVYENIAYPLRERKMPQNEISRKVRSVAATLHIEHLLDRQEPATLSGGEMQRVALARTLVREPRLYLLDEPITNLDAKLREEMRSEFRRIHTELKQTILYATPDFIEALSIGEKIAIVKDGKVIQFDDPANILDHPLDKFVATFVGSPTINLLHGQLSRIERELYFDCSGVRINLTELAGDWVNKLTGEEAVLGVRPTDIRILLREELGTIASKVVTTEPLGHETVVTALVDDLELKIVAKGFVGLKHGQPIWLDMNKQRLHIIDPQTEKVVL